MSTPVSASYCVQRASEILTHVPERATEALAWSALAIALHITERETTAIDHAMLVTIAETAATFIDRPTQDGHQKLAWLVQRWELGEPHGDHQA